MRHASAASTGPGGFICCLLGQEQYALHAADVRIAARAEQMRLESTSAAGRVGTLTHGGHDLPVYSLSALFGRTPDRSGIDRHVIVTRGAGGNAYGLLVDRMLRAPSEHPGQLLPIPASVGGVAAEWFDGMLGFGDDLSCLVLSTSALDPRRPAGAPRTDGRAERVVRRVAARSAAAVEIVTTFTSDALPAIGIGRFALGASRVAAVTQALPSIPIPGAAPWVAQLGAWRDHAVPVISFNTNAHDYRNGSRRYLVVRTGGRFSGGFVAFAVGDDIELHRATEASADPAIQRVDAPFVIGTYMVGSQPVALLDIDKLASGGVPAASRRPAPKPAPQPLPLVV